MSTIYAADRGANDSGESTKTKSPDDQLLAKIRRRFDYMVQAWKPIRDKAESDMRAQSDDGPWKPEDRAERLKNKRPCIHLDQLEQYPNNLVNEVRQNPPEIKANPAGAGTDDKTAALRSNRVRQIQYESNATQATLRAFEDAAQ